jgi:hypothetical protein
MVSDPSLADGVPPVIARARTFPGSQAEHRGHGRETTRCENNNTSHRVIS